MYPALYVCSKFNGTIRDIILKWPHYYSLFSNTKVFGFCTRYKGRMCRQSLFTEVVVRYRIPKLNARWIILMAVDLLEKAE